MKCILFVFSFTIFISGLKCQADKIKDSIYTVLDKQAEFIGGDESLLNFLSDNLKYQENCEECDGTVWIQFVILLDSTIKDVKIYGNHKTSLTPLENEAIRVINLTNMKWIPGKVKDKYVSSYYKIPITFKIESR